MEAAAYAVDTDELLGTAGHLRVAATSATGHRATLDREADLVDGWVSAQSVQAAHAFLATLARAADGASTGLTDLARRTAVAGGGYDRTEQGVPFPR